MRLRQQDNIADLDVKIQVIAQEILGLDRALADVVAIASYWLRFRQLHVLRSHRYDHPRVLVDALARMRLDLAHRRTHDAAPVTERGDHSTNFIGGMVTALGDDSSVVSSAMGEIKAQHPSPSAVTIPPMKLVVPTKSATNLSVGCS